MSLLSLRKNRNLVQRTNADKIYDAFNAILMVTMLIIFLYPLWFFVIASISNQADVKLGKVILLPSQPTFLAFERVFTHKEIPRTFVNSIFYTIIPSFLGSFFAMCIGYCFTRKKLPGRGIILTLFTIPMFFGGGLVPTYITMKQVGLLNNPLLLLIIGTVSTYNAIVCRSFIQATIPEEMMEAARIDGSNNLGILFRIIFPLSKPVIAVLTMFSLVSYWNDYMTAMIYIRNRTWYPLQMICFELLNSSASLMSSVGGISSLSAEEISELVNLNESIKYALIIITSVPVMLVYPYAQKYFAQGYMIGAVKG